MTLRVVTGVVVPLAPARPAAPQALAVSTAPAVPLYGQQAANWCWAACAQMLGDARGLGVKLTQGTLAERYVPATNCCGVWPVPPACDDGLDVSVITKLYAENAVGLEAVPRDGPLAEPDLIALLARGPVQVFWTSVDGSMAHVALIVGVRADPQGKHLFEVHDPLPVAPTAAGGGQRRTLAYADLAPSLYSAYGWNWSHTWSSHAH